MNRKFSDRFRAEGEATAARPASPKGRRDRQGIVMFLVAVALMVIAAVAALAVDGGRVLAERQQVQAAADASAMAGAVVLYDADVRGEPQASGAARTSALAIAQANGYIAGENCSIDAFSPPNSGDYAGRSGYIEVVIESRQPRSFSSVFGSGDLRVTGRAIAAGTLGPTKASVLLLEPKAERVLKLNKGGSLLETAGDVIVNSKSKKSADLGTGTEIVADNIIFSGALEKKLLKRLETVARGDVYQKADPTPDPLAGLPEPEAGPARKIGDYRTSENGKNVYHLPPGTYGEELKFDKDDVVYLEPGVYDLQRGLTLRKGAVFEARGVTLYSQKRGLKVESSTVTLTPPASGPYAGVSVFLSPKGKGKIAFKKDTGLDISGILYAPNGDVSVHKSDLDLDAFVDDGALDPPVDPADESGEVNPPDLAVTAELHASIIARRLKLEKGAHVVLQGRDIAARRPVLRLVE